MQENHSFDAYFGSLNRPKYYGNAVDGIQTDTLLADKDENKVSPFHEATFCPRDPPHKWDNAINSWNQGKNDGFLTENHDAVGKHVLAYQTEDELPLYYSLADQFAIADRYFSSALGPTYPNRFFLYTGTSFGHIDNDRPPSGTKYQQKSIFDLLSQNKVSWKYYYEAPNDYIGLIDGLDYKSKNVVRFKEFFKDLNSGNLPSVIFIDSAENYADEHPHANILTGQKWVASILKPFFSSSLWSNSAIILTYDENGGFYDHVPPPEACDPSGKTPTSSGILLDRYGFRVPFILISPYAKHHFVSHTVYDHTSILRYVENQFNLPSLTFRDANAQSFDEMFDYNFPILETKPIPNLDIASFPECTELWAIGFNIYTYLDHIIEEFFLDVRELFNL